MGNPAHSLSNPGAPDAPKFPVFPLLFNMLSLNRTWSDSPPSAAPEDARGKSAETWLDRILPARGFERTAFLVLAALTLAFKILAIYHFRSDSDETQHAHVVWAWGTGQLQYRDVFDNHMPLFQMACAPLMALFGERPDIIMVLRWLMLPLYFVCLWAVFRLAGLLYSRRAAPWCALFAGTFCLFFYTSTEFRTDDLWAALWLLSLVVAVSGRFGLGRALAFGLLAGLAFAVSLKTVVLVFALGTAVLLAVVLGWRRGWRIGPAQAAARLLAVAVGALIPPAATALYFYRQGAFWIMEYCVIAHNVLPRLKRWGHFGYNQWYFPVSILFMAGYAWLIFRQTPDTRLAMRRTVTALVPFVFIVLLFSYWPDITREDDLPYTPLLPLALIPLLMLPLALVRSDLWRQRLWTYALPALALCNFVSTARFHNIWDDRLRVTTHAIRDVLSLTSPGDFVMENKGDYVFRPRAYYWVLEPITKARVRDGLIHDSIPRRLIEKGVKVCYLYCGRDGSLAAQFIVANYVPFDPQALDIGILGKEIGYSASDGTFSFDVTIPQTYAVVTEGGTLSGVLDGQPYSGPVWIGAGSHVFRRTGGSGRAGIMLADACTKGYTFLFDKDERIVHTLGALPPKRRGRKPELQ